MDIEYVRSRFIKHFDGTTGSVYASPGRINLIGEHTDYNGGFVFPGAVDKGMIAEIKPNGTDKVRAYSIDLKDYVEFGLNEEDAPKASWARYIFGVCREMIKRGVDVKGFDTAFAGDVPLGAGMSSSAALESTYAFAINELFGDNKIDKFELAKVGQATEHNYCGVNCGIMDQFAIAMGKKDNAIFLDTATLEYEYAPVKLQGAKIVISCSNKKRGLGSSKYNERRSECEMALSEIQSGMGIKTLGDLTEEQFESVKMAIKDEDRRKRAKHAVYENQRTIKAVEALKANDIALFGKLMNESHVSLRDDYEVTGEELDTLVEAAWKIDGVIGSRMTGAGFGGCTVSIVKDEAVDRFIDQVGKTYKETIGYAADFYVVEIGSGPCEL